MKILRQRYQSSDIIPIRRRTVNSITREKELTINPDKRKNELRDHETKRENYEQSLNFLRDNELYRNYLLKKIKKENEEMIEDTIASEIRKENEKRVFLNEVEKTSNILPKYKIENYIKCLDKCLFNKEFYGTREYQLRKDKEHNQKYLRNFYDIQVMEKKLKKEYERYIDKFQAEIWKKDSNDFLEHEIQIKDMVRQYEKSNEKELVRQIQIGKYDIDKMTLFERKYNSDLLQKAKDFFHKRNCFY